MSLRAELLAIVGKEDVTAVIQFVKNAKAKGVTLSDTLSECSQRNKEDMWESLRKVCSEVLLDDEVEQDEDLDKQKRDSHHAFLDCLVTLASATIQQKDVVLPQALMDTGALLHGVLLTLPEEMEGMKYRLAQLFEAWWRRGLPGWEDVIANTFVYLLKRSLTNGTMTEVKLVSRMQSVLTLVNFEAPSAGELKNLLGRCCSTAQYIRTDEGRRFLGYVLTLNTGLVDCMHRAIKNQIPYAPKSWLPMYGDVYFRAWQKSSGQTLQKIENDCIQDLMNHAIHASREGPQPMSLTLFRVMNAFHRQKKQRGVDEMLLRLYNPILWRALTVPNTDVRANSAGLLLDAFPLQDPNSTAEDTDVLIQKQFDLMQRLLTDPCPGVRALTVEGVCRIVSDYLEMIPGEVVQAVLCKLLKELAWDTASPSVRLAVVKGMIRMLDNTLCHMLLKPLLPSLSLCLHDKAEVVRIAMVDLLLKVKGIRSFKYWTISPIEHLLARLETDSHPVVRRIVELLFPSFLPLDQNAQEQVSRCLTLLEYNSGAARVFFLNASRHMTLTDTVKYMALLCRYVLESVRSLSSSLDCSQGETGGKSKGRESKRSKDEQRAAGEKEEDDESEESDDERLTPEILQGLLEAIFLMWTSVAKQLDSEGNAELKQSIMKKLSVTLPEVLKVTQDPKVMSLVVEIAGHLPPKAVPTLSRGCVSKLRKMPDGSDEGDYTELLEAACLWEMAPQVLELISDWLEDRLAVAETGGQPCSEKNQKGGKKRVQIAAPEEEKRPQLALDYLKTMLKSAVCKRVLLNQHCPLVVTVNQLLSRVTGLIETYLKTEQRRDREMEKFMETALSLHLRFAVLLNDTETEGGDCTQRIMELLRWGQEHLLPALRHGSEGKTSAEGEKTSKEQEGVLSETTADFAVACVSVTLMICSHMLMVGVANADLVEVLVTFCQTVLAKEVGVWLVDQVLSCLQQLAMFEELGAAGPVAKCMSAVMVAFNSFHRHRPLPDPKILSSIKSKIGGLITCVTSSHGNALTGGEEEVAIVTELTSTMLAAVIAELQNASRQDKLTAEPADDGQDSSLTVSTCILTCYSRSAHTRRLFVQEAENCIKSGAITDIHSVHAVVHLLTLIKSKGLFTRDMDLTPLQSAVSTMVNSVSSQHPDSQEEDEDVFRETLAAVQTKLQTVLGKS